VAYLFAQVTYLLCQNPGSATMSLYSVGLPSVPNIRARVCEGKATARADRGEMMTVYCSSVLLEPDSNRPTDQRPVIHQPRIEQARRGLSILVLCRVLG